LPGSQPQDHNPKDKSLGLKSLASRMLLSWDLWVCE
jgi:hypothetical protein